MNVELIRNGECSRTNIEKGLLTPETFINIHEIVFHDLVISSQGCVIVGHVIVKKREQAPEDDHGFLLIVGLLVGDFATSLVPNLGRNLERFIVGIDWPRVVQLTSADISGLCVVLEEAQAGIHVDIYNSTSVEKPLRTNAKGFQTYFFLHVLAHQRIWSGLVHAQGLWDQSSSIKALAVVP
jgi:hypothetical protein